MPPKPYLIHIEGLSTEFIELLEATSRAALACLDRPATLG